MYDLPSEDPEEPGLPDEFHDLQPQLLSRTLRLSRYGRENCFTASDLNLYYDVAHPLWQKRPDWFLVVGVSRLYEGQDLRRSYVVWQEGRFPSVIVEFLSPGTEADDLGRFHSAVTTATSPELNGESSQNIRPPGKLEVYEQYLRVPHYIVYSRYTRQLRYFKLEGGQYQEQPVGEVAPFIWLDDLEIGLGIWQGEFEGVPDSWLRWCDREGNWLLTDTEQEQFEKEQERLEKEQERAAKEQAQSQLLQTARNLLATGMELEQVIAIAGLTEEQVRALDRTEP
ncbi:Uma2 family endonuclease [Cyanobacteria bacterium FACHB-471]|nr:Uma2 family endonuclease [Cyanobacteria bacterium FACHB-471]